MFNGKTVAIIVVALFVGFASGFVMRPAIAPAQQAAKATSVRSTAPASSDVRGTQYFVANIDDARRVVAGCRDGSVRGGECATAEEAIINVEAAERRRKFLGN